MGSRQSDRFHEDVELGGMPEHTLLGIVKIPSASISPVRLILRRCMYAIGLLLATAVVVYLDRDGYNVELTFIDALYYSAVTLSTTGYGRYFLAMILTLSLVCNHITFSMFFVNRNLLN